jgi:hypothetical protein
MKMKTSPTTIILALAAMGFVASSADAALTYNDGDLFLGFRATGGTGNTIDILVDLGSAMQFDTGGSFTSGGKIALNIGNIGQDLVNQYGALWFNRSDVLWGVFGVQKIANTSYPNNTLFASVEQTTPGVSTPWAKRSVSNSSGIAGKIQAVGQLFGQGATTLNGGGLANGDQVESTNSSFTLIQPTAINTNSYRANQPGGSNTGATTAFGSFVNLDGAIGIEGDFASGTADTSLDLYKLIPAAGGASGALLGTFSINDAGNVSFIASTSIPEPSAFAMLGTGTLLLGALRRRRS